MSFALIILIAPSFKGLAAAPIATSFALNPFKGGTIYRQQLRYKRINNNDALETPAFLLYGLHPRLALLTSVNPSIDESGETQLESTGAGIKWQYVQYNVIGATLRMALIANGGSWRIANQANQSAYTQIGNAITFEKLLFEVDLETRYMRVFDGDEQGHYYYNLSFSHVIWPFAFPEYGVPTYLNAVIEMNGRSIQTITNRFTNQLRISPGLQIVDKNFILEGNVQIPVTENTELYSVLGIRWVF